VEFGGRCHREREMMGRGGAPEGKDVANLFTSQVSGATSGSVSPIHSSLLALTNGSELRERWRGEEGESKLAADHDQGDGNVRGDLDSARMQRGRRMCMALRNALGSLARLP